MSSKTNKKPKKSKAAGQGFDAVPPNPFSDGTDRFKELKPFILSDKFKSLALMMAIAVAVIYIGFQVVASTFKPELSIKDTDTARVSTSEVAYIEGVTSEEASISINGAAAVVNSDGSFRTRVILSEGVNRFNVVAKSQLSRVNEQEVVIVFEK